MALYSLFRSVRTELGKVCLAQHVQSLYTSCPSLAADKTLLLKLRKSTGYTFINCKKALEKFNNDITQAERWLHEQAQKEGWSKASRLEGRKAKEGLVGVMMGDNAAVMVEVNCETDFVARNEKFQQLVKDVALSIMAHHSSKGQSGNVKSVLSSDDLTKLQMPEGPTLRDQIALTIGRLGENIGMRRAVSLSVPSDWHIGTYVHGAVPGQVGIQMGRYGALVVFQGGPKEGTETLGRKLGQHIVGEAPVTLGSMDDIPCGESETRLLPQTFLPDPKYTVGQYLTLQDARVLDFVRFQCGESTSQEAE
ncbi:elongation factor Ts, mitochondrial [Myxocyprinus asiaticus]|uniref:elongation factor Ts, mitochondrial n=1 Tax=Myxocyprinus asiaticus TaxID=70543 RepID=UPI0022219DD5|nr:elongation factor Ts, mitochondrial [Myxocyprinus asiaticus]